MLKYYLEKKREKESSLFKTFHISLEKKKKKSSKVWTAIFQWASSLKKQTSGDTEPPKRDTSLQQTKIGNSQHEPSENGQESKPHAPGISPASKSNIRVHEDIIEKKKSSKSPQIASAGPNERTQSTEEIVLQDEDNPYQDICHETDLLVEIKDVLDELNILKTLAQEQDHVDDMWKQIKKKQKSNHAVTPSEISREIESMIGDAKSVQEDINTLLDLKQKEASIIEAKATREQSDTLMTFTVVTIIFVSILHFIE